MSETSKTTLVKGAAVLAVAGIVVKVFGAAFRIILAGFITDQGMAYYTPAYSIYAVLLVISTSGIPIAISRMVSERYAIGRYDEADRVFHISRYLMISLGVLGFIVLFFLADPIASAMKLKGSALAMRATAPALLIVPIMSSYRGYFQGQQRMTPTALSQTVEQIFRVVFGLALAIVLMRGTLFAESFTDLQRGAAGGCFGASAGAIGGLAVMLIIYFGARKSIRTRIAESDEGDREGAGSILKGILVIAVPITLGAMLMPLVNLVDASVVKIRLMDIGLAEDAAESLYGQLTGFCEPIIALPQVLMSAIVMSIVPMVAAANKIGDRARLHETISLGLRMSSIVAFPCAIGLLILAKPALTMLFFTQKESAANAAPSLRVLSISFILLAIITIMTGVLQGVGRQIWPVINLFIGLLFKVAVTWILVGTETFNVVGAPLGTMAAYLIAGGLDLYCLRRFTGTKLDLKLMILKPFLSALVMGVVVAGVYYGLVTLTSSNTLSTLLSIVAGALVYGLMIVRTKSIGREELMEISFGRKLAGLFDRLRLW